MSEPLLHANVCIAMRALLPLVSPSVRNMERKQPEPDKERAKKCVQGALGKGQSFDDFLTSQVWTEECFSDNFILNTIKESHNLEDFKEIWTSADKVPDMFQGWVLALVSRNKVGSKIMIESDWIIPSLFEIAHSNAEWTHDYIIEPIYNIASICGCSSKRSKELREHHPKFAQKIFMALFKCHERHGEEQSSLVMLLTAVNCMLHAKGNGFGEDFYGLTKDDFCKFVHLMPLQSSIETADITYKVLATFQMLCEKVGFNIGDACWRDELVTKCDNWMRNPRTKSTHRLVIGTLVLIKRKSGVVNKTDLPRDIWMWSDLQKNVHRGGRKCCEIGCWKRGTKTCTGCFGVYYCSATCQRTHWKAHKKICTRLRQDLPTDD